MTNETALQPELGFNPNALPCTGSPKERGRSPGGKVIYDVRQD